MADLNTITTNYVAKSDVSGLDKITAAADKAAASTEKLSKATTSLVSATEKSDKSALGVAAQLDRLSRAADPAQAALVKLERQQRLIDAATKTGQPIRQEWTNALAILKAHHEELTKATNEHAAAQGLSRVQMMESMHVAKSLADSIIAGASPMRALAVEGGRIAQIFAEGNGGVGGTLKAMGGTVARLATGWLGLGAAVAAGAGLAVAALYRFQSQQDRLATSLNGAGRYSGVSVAGLTSIANAAGARNPWLGQGGATNLAATYASTGRIAAGLMPGLLDVAAPYARGTGQDITKAGEELAKAFSEPGKGAEQLNDKLGFLDDKTKQLIASLERQGDLFGAQQVLLGKVGDAAAQMADHTWGIVKAWDALTTAVGNGANAFGSGVSRALNPTIADKLDLALRQRGNLQHDYDTAWGGRASIGRSLADADGNISRLRLGAAYQEYGDSRLAGGAASDKATNDLSVSIGDAVRKALPEIDKTQELTDTLKLLDDALRNPETAGKVVGGAGAIETARGRYANQLAYSDPLQRIQQDSALSAQAAQASTGAERTLIEARRAELEVLRATGDATQAAAKSLGVWNEEIAKSNKEAEDAVRNSSRNLDMSLMRPFERGAQEIRNRYEDSRRGAVTGPVSSLSSDDLRMTALDPFGDLSPASSAFAHAKLTNRVIPGMHARSLAAYRDLNPGTASASSDVTVNAAPAPPAVGAYAPAAARFAPGNITVHGGGSAIRATSSSGYASAQSNDLGAYYNAETLAKIQASGDELDRQNKLLAVRFSNLGKSNEAMQKAVAEQELWNSLQLDDKALKELGPTRVAKLTSAISDQADAQVKLNKQTQQYDQVVSASNWFQQTGNSVVSDFGSSFGDLYNANPRDLVSKLKVGDQAKYYSGQLSGGQVKSKVFQMQAGDFLRNLMFQQGVGLVQKGLFGSGTLGQPGYQSGLLGGVFNSILGGFSGIGSAGAPMQLSGATGGGGGGLFSGIAHLFGFADGGIMTSRGAVPLRRYAAGGVANTPQLAMFGEGGKPEAYVPLNDGRTIPVSMKGGGGGAPAVNFRGGDLHVHGSIDSATLPQVQAMIIASNKQTSMELQRNFGPMSSKWAGRFGS